MVVLIIIVVLVAIVIALIVMRNNLVVARQRVKNAWSQIDVQLQRRFDLIPNFVETVKGYMTHEQETFEKIAQLRTSWANAESVSDKAKLDGELSTTLKTIMAVSESYPELKANQNFSELSEELRNTENNISLVEVPYRFEAGTPNISGIISFSEAIKFLNMVSMEYIERVESHLRKYLVSELKKIPYVKIYNENSESSIVLINIDGITSGDLGLYLNSKNICVRSGKHCTKMLVDESEYSDTVRISLYFYNTYEEIDKLILSLKDKLSINEFIK